MLGCSIAGVWLVEMMGDKIKFFVDEDPHRRGTGPFGLPVIGLDEVESGAKILLPFPPEIAGAIASRLSKTRTDVEFIAPKNS